MKSHPHHLNQFILMRGFENVLLGGLCSQVHPSLGLLKLFNGLPADMRRSTKMPSPIDSIL